MLLSFILIAAVGAEPMPVAATVNGEEIPLSRVDAYIRTKLAILPASNSQSKQLRSEVLHDMIDDVLLKQFLVKNAPKVEAAEIDKQLAAFSDSLARKGRSLAKFLEETKQTEAELRDSWLITMQLDGYIRKTVTDEQLKAYYTANKDHFDRVEVNASHILIRLNAKATPLEQATAKEKLQAIRTGILAGKLDFAAAARKHSQCPSATDNGNLGWLPRKGGPMDEPCSKIAFTLKPGDISEVVTTESGLHLIRVTERKPGNPSQFEKCMDEVREVYADEQRPALIAKLRQDATIKVTLP